MPCRWLQLLSWVCVLWWEDGLSCGCAGWCNEYTCNNDDGRCPNCIADCKRCPVCAVPPSPPPHPEPTPPSPPHPPTVPLTSFGAREADYWTQKDKIFTNAFGDGEPSRLIVKGASWSGMEAKPCYFHGLDVMPLESVLHFLEENGFNAVRLPIAVSAILEGSRPRCMEDGGFYYNQNRALREMDFPTLLRHVVLEMGKKGILVMLDLHSMGPGEWPDKGIIGPPERLLLEQAWSVLAEYLCPVAFWNVFAADLKNEPHGMHWGKGGAETRWDQVATTIGEVVHARCPRWLIVTEGVGHCMDDTNGRPSSTCSDPSAQGQDMSIATWWGENLQAVRDAPVEPRNAKSKVVYSPHAYGPGVYDQPYFQEEDFPENMPRIWHKQWGYIVDEGIAPVLIGEWGGRNGGSDHVWQLKMTDYLREHEIGSFYWCLNPESQDTGGLFLSMALGGSPDEVKLEMLRSLPATKVPGSNSNDRWKAFTSQLRAPKSIAEIQAAMLAPPPPSPMPLLAPLPSPSQPVVKPSEAIDMHPAAAERTRPSHPPSKTSIFLSPSLIVAPLSQSPLDEVTDRMDVVSGSQLSPMLMVLLAAICFLVSCMGANMIARTLARPTAMRGSSTNVRGKKVRHHRVRCSEPPPLIATNSSDMFDDERADIEL
ncbi:hypothetical protein AB1Y20_004490 [Prymnesium parvum]|uniref:Glycoside hydrolase family 5 domain-containing protein n=1 Tax=Prymnesium parvum TaxID=97485 RepID=A0AB34IWZ2_PRYPA